MPWAQKHIDLSFPELPKMLDLDTKPEPRTEDYYLLAY